VKNGIGKSGDCSDGAVTEELLAPLGLTLADVPIVEQQLQKSMELAGAFLNAYR
jgi:hypothetical protein